MKSKLLMCTAAAMIFSAPVMITSEAYATATGYVGLGDTTARIVDICQKLEDKIDQCIEENCSRYTIPSEAYSSCVWSKCGGEMYDWQTSECFEIIYPQ